jgi:glycosyltransferase involved in cell wall biosynthesis
MSEVGLSVLIPNYNYARYIGETIESVLVQKHSSFEIVVADNASTDDSVAVVERFRDPRIHITVNPCNLGFAANLERVAGMAHGRRMLLLSSDDRMKPEALEAYRKLETALGPQAERAIWGSSTTIIDSHGAQTGVLPPDAKLWRDGEVDAELSAAVGYPVRTMPAVAMLRRSLELLRSPLPFATTCYPRSLHDAVGGYAGGRLMNPDKWFLWKLLSVADTIHVIDHPLFEYRVHNQGQNAQEENSGALKHLTDEYVATFNLPESVIARAGLDRQALARAFVEHDIALRGLVALAEGKRIRAKRGLLFGMAAYPDVVRRNPKVWMLRGLLHLGPVGTGIARSMRESVQQRWTARESTKR